MPFRSLAALLGGTPASTTDTPGEPANTRFVGFGEALTSAIANRPHYALAENTDNLNDRIAAWEASGLDAAYDLGLAAVTGGGRIITKDGGAIESRSTVSAQYEDDKGNFHFRASGINDTTGGTGGFEYQGGRDATEVVSGSGFAGFLDRRAYGLQPAGFESRFEEDEAVSLNPGGAATTTVRLTTGGRYFYTIEAGPTPPAGNYTNLNLGVDLIEILGGTDPGLYVITGLGATATDVTVSRLDGSAPSFTNEATTATVYRMKFGSIGTDAARSSFLQNNIFLASKAGSSALDVLAGGDESVSDAFRALYRHSSGTPQEAFVLDRYGRANWTLESSDLPDGFSSAVGQVGRIGGGGYATKVLREGSGSGLRGSFTHMVKSSNNITTGRYDFASFVPLEIAASSVTTAMAIDFKAASATDGEVDFGAGVALDSDAFNSLPPYGTMVEIVSGDASAQGIYILWYMIAGGGGVPAMRILNPDHTTPTHLPTSGSGTVRFYAVSRLGRNPSVSGLAGTIDAFPGENGDMTPYNVMMGGSEQDAASLTLFSAGNVIVGDDRALIRGFSMGFTEGDLPIEIFSVTPGDGPVGGAGPDYGRVNGYVFQALQGYRINNTDGEVVYANPAGTPTPRTRFKMVPLGAGGMPLTSAADPWEYNFSAWASTAVNRVIQFDLTPMIPQGGTLVAVEVYLEPGAIRATSTDRVQCQISRDTVDWVTPGLTTVYGTAQPDDGTADAQVVRVVAAAPHITPDNENVRIFLNVTSGLTAGNDVISAIRIEITDPGPRNY